MKTDKSSPYFSFQARGTTRSGVLTTRAGQLLTPTFMPDGTRGAVKGLEPVQVRQPEYKRF